MSRARRDPNGVQTASNMKSNKNLRNKLRFEHDVSSVNLSNRSNSESPANSRVKIYETEVRKVQFIKTPSASLPK